MRLLIGLDELKNYLNIDLDTTTNDEILSVFLSSASAYIIDNCKRLLTYETLTEYYSGNGKPRLRLDNFPVISTESNIDVRVDADREFGTDTQIDAGDIALDQKSGMIELVENIFDEGVKNIKAVYKAGFSNFVIEPGANKLDFKEGETAKLATITAGQYNADQLVAEIQKQMRASGSNTYEVSYSIELQKFVISADANFDLMFETGANAAATMRKVIGFDGVDNEGLDEYTADFARSGVPHDLRIATLMLAEKFWNESKVGESRAGIRSANSDLGNVTYITDDVPPFVNVIIKKYRRYD